MGIALRAAEPTDLHALASLFDEMDRFYGATGSPPVEERLDGIHAALFGEHPAARALLALDGDDLVGMACYSFLWPAVGVTRSLYLKELYVARAHWRRGVGARLMRGVSAAALRHGCSRVEWTANTDDPAAVAFYEALGAEVNRNKAFFRVEGAMIADLAGGAPPG